MTVEELIKELEGYPKDAEVVDFVYDEPILYAIFDKDTEQVQLVY